MKLEDQATVTVTALLSQAATQLPLLEIVPDRRDLPVNDVVIYDSCDAGADAEADLVLGVGLSGPGALVKAIRSLATNKAAALIVREECLEEKARVAADSAGLSLWVVQENTSWARLLARLQGLLRQAASPTPGVNALAQPVTADLFALADLLAETVDGSVTIEDPDSKLLAYSKRQDEMDPARQATILGRQVPAEIVSKDRDEGLFRRLQGARRPIFVRINEPGYLSRLVVTLEWAGQTLGYAWAAVRDEPSPQRQRAFHQAAKRVAVQLFRRQAESDKAGWARRTLALELLGGSPQAAAAAERLGLVAEEYRVLRVGNRSREPDQAHLPQSLLRDVDAQLAAFHVQAAAAEVDADCYVILAMNHGGESGQQRALRNAAELLNRLPHAGRDVVVAVSSRATAVADLPRARQEVDNTMRVLRSDQRLPNVADPTAVRVSAWNLAAIEAAAAATSGMLAGPLDLLIADDDRRRTKNLASLQAFLESLGDINAAAATMGVHPNTMRYRLRRIAEIGDLNLSDASHWLAALLHLKVLQISGRSMLHGRGPGHPATDDEA